MNPTNPTRRPVDSTTHAPTTGPQPFGTGFGRWQHIYVAAPAFQATSDIEPTILPKRSSLTVAA